MATILMLLVFAAKIGLFRRRLINVSFSLLQIKYFDPFY